MRGSDAWYWIAGTTFVGGFMLALNLMESPTGRALQAIHDSEIASLVLGIDVARKKLTIFIISAMYASVAGSYLALFNGHVTPDVAGFLRSIELVAMVVLGGMGSIVGSLVGAAVLVVLPQALTVFHEYEQALLGLIVMVFMIFLRRGIVPSLLPRSQGGANDDPGDRSAVHYLRWRAGHRWRQSRIASGQVFSIIGPNGSGKTTLFNLVSGIYTPNDGSIRLAGETVTGLAPDQLARRGLSRTFQNLQIFSRMSVLENVMVGRHRHERTGILADLLHWPSVARQNEATREAARAALARVGLADAADRPAGSLAYGALKRLEIARALASEPKVLLLDEPAAGCNPVETQEIDRVIRSIVKDGITVVLVEHDMRLVMNISDRVHVLASGRTLAEGTPEQVRSNAAVIEAYLGVHGSQEAARAFD